MNKHAAAVDAAFAEDAPDGRSDAYAETIRAIFGEMLARTPGAAGKTS